MSITIEEAAEELLARRKARSGLLAYITYCNPKYHQSDFATQVCAALDKFIEDVHSGKRPVLILEAPPQHGKSEIVSRNLPAYLLGKYPDMRIAAASYSNGLAGSMSLEVRRNMASAAHLRLFKDKTGKRKYTVNRNGEFSAPNGRGSYISDGVGGGFTGRPADIFIVDDPIKNNEEALSEVTKEKIWNWFQSTSKTRMSKNSGHIVMATRWAEDDLSGRIVEMYRELDTDRLTVLSFPAINAPTESGYNRNLPMGALVPDLHPLEQLLEIKSELSEYWFASLYQQEPQAIGGNVFKEEGIQFYLPKDLPESFDNVIDSWDCTFKDTDGTDYVVGGKWGKKGANSYLLRLVRARMSFTKTALEVKNLSLQLPHPREILIEDKANGPAVIDFLKKEVPRLKAVEPDGSKLARAHAVTSVWESGNIFVPHPDIAPWVGSKDRHSHKPGTYLSEMTRFPAAANDDQVDMTTQALRALYPAFTRMRISGAALRVAGRR